MGVRIRVSVYIYVGAGGPCYMGLAPLATATVMLLVLASRGGDAGIGVGDLRTIPVPVIPDGDNYPTNFIPVGINSPPSPSPNRRILHGESEIGSPLPSLF